MAFVEDFRPFFADFGGVGVLDGQAVTIMLDESSEVWDGDVMSHAPSALLQPTTAVVPTSGMTLLAGTRTYTVRQVLKEPPDGALLRLVLAQV